MVVKTAYTTYKAQGLKGLGALLKYYRYKACAKVRLPFVSKGVQCPVCGWQGAGYHPYYLPNLAWVRPGAVCPNCQSLERHRGFYHYYKALIENEPLLKNVKDGAKPLRCLHFAPEACLVPLFEGHSAIAYVQSNYAGPGVGDMQAISEADTSIDWLLSHHVMEHVEDDLKALSEIHRVLKPGGVCYLSVPLTWSAPTDEFGYAKPEENDHWRQYGHNIGQKFEQQPWASWQRINFKEYFTPAQIKRLGLNPEEPFFKLIK